MIDIEAKKLLSVLKTVSRAVPRKSTIQVLEHVLIESDGERLHVSANNLEIGMTAKVEHQCEPLAFTAPAQELQGILSKIMGVVRIQADKHLTITAGRSRYRLETLRPEDFPAMPVVDDAVTAIVKPSALTELLDRVVYAAAKNDVRYYLNGVCLEIGDGNITAVASDGHRLAASETDAKVSGDPIQVIVPNDAVGSITKIAKHQGDVDVILDVCRSKLRVRCGSVELAAKLIEGKYPDWRRVVPDDVNSIRVNADVLRETVERCAAVSRDVTVVKLTGGGDTLDIEVTDNNGRQATDSVPAGIGKPIRIGFNPRYLIEGLRGFSGDQEIGIGDTGALKVQDGSRLAVVMPVRL